MSVLEDGSAVRTNESGELVLSLSKLRPRPRWIELEGASGETVSVKVPGNLPLHRMMYLREIEGRLVQATDEEALVALSDLEEEFAAIIADGNPDVDVELNLDAVQAVALFGFLARPHDDLATLWVDALTAGRGEKPDAASDDAHEIAQRAGIEDADSEESGRPLPSTKPSSRRSSASANSTAGRRSGGSTRAARGRRSGSTSRTRSSNSASGSETETA